MPGLESTLNSQTCAGSVAEFRGRVEEFETMAAERPEQAAKPVLALADVRRQVATLRRQGARLLESLQAGATVEEVTADQHFLAVACVHAVAAVHRANGCGWTLPVMPRRYVEGLQLLRNIYEHWISYTPWRDDGCFKDGTARTNAKRLVKIWPGAQPFRYTFDGRLGGCIPLADLDAYFAQLAALVDEADPDRVAMSIRVSLPTPGAPPRTPRATPLGKNTLAAQLLEALRTYRDRYPRRPVPTRQGITSAARVAFATYVQEEAELAAAGVARA